MSSQNRTIRRLGVASPAPRHSEVKASCSSGIRLRGVGVSVRLSPRIGLANGNERTRERFEEAVRHQAAGRLVEAEACYRDVLRRAPEHADALNNLGLVLLNQGVVDLARTTFQNAIARRLDFPEAYCNLGIVNKLTGHLGRAEADFQRALSFRPDFAEALYHLGSLLGVQGRYEQAALHLKRALELAGEFLPALVDLGIALRETGRLDEAEVVLGRAVALEPGNAEAKYSLALVWLSCGRFSEAWPYFERRELEHPADLSSIVEWQGEPLDGKRILLVGERCVEDQVQFIRYAGVLADLGATVEVWTLPELVDLLDTAKGVTRVWAEPPVARFDYWSFLLSVPARLGARTGTIPVGAPYLTVHPYMGAAANERANGYSKRRLKVALAWADVTRAQGALAATVRQLLQFHSIADQIAWFAIANVNARAVSEEMPEDADIYPLWTDMIDLQGVAAAISATDILVCTDPMLAHVAGALGHPTWLMLADKWDWRWSVRVEGGSVWYPSVRCFDRETYTSVTNDFAARLARELQSRIHEKSTIPAGPGRFDPCVSFSDECVLTLGGLMDKRAVKVV